MNKYGVDNFYYEVLEDKIPYNKLDDKEIYYIDKYDSYKHGYNSTPGGDGKTLNKLEDVTEIIKRLQQGELVKDIAKSYNVNTVTIQRNLKSYGIHAPTDIQLNTHKKEYLRTLPRERIKELYLQGKSHQEIAKSLDINQRSVSRVVKEFGINKRKMIDYSKLDLDAIMYDYDNNTLPVTNIWKKYGINQHSIKVIRKMKQY